MAAGNQRLRFQLPITDPAKLKLFVKAALGIDIPDTRCCADHSTPWEAFTDAYFCVSPVVVWKASRGFGGKSYLLSALAMTEALTLHCDVNLLGGSGEQSKRVLEALQAFGVSYEHFPRQAVLGDVGRETRFVHGNTVRALTASQRSVRGPHPSRLRCDEADEMELPILDAALGQPMEKDGVPAQTVISSTHQYADGTMTEVLRRAREKGFPTREWCYRETLEPHGWLSQTQVEATRLTVPQAMWETEYEGQEPNPEGRAIDTDAVRAMFDPKLGRYKGRLGEAIEIIPPGRGHEFATSADWAKRRDNTVILTARTDSNPMLWAAFLAISRRPWPDMIGRFDARVKRYGGRAAHDRTGIGDVVHDVMKSRAKPIVMAGKQWQDALTEYVAAVERGEYRAPMIELAYHEHLYASVDAVYGHDHLPDTISAGAMLHALVSSPRAAWATV